jgi:hypothetical protein
MDKFVERNQQVANELFALVEKIGFGKLDFSLEVHSKRVASWDVSGRRRWTFDKKDKEAPYKLMLRRLKKGEDEKRTETVVFVITREKGDIRSVEQFVDIKRNYDSLESPLDNNL